MQTRKTVLPGGVAAQGGVFVIVQSRTLQLCVLQGEAQGMHEMQPRAGVGAQPNDIAAVGRNFRLEKHYIEHMRTTQDASQGVQFT